MHCHYFCEVLQPLQNYLGQARDCTLAAWVAMYLSFTKHNPLFEGITENSPLLEGILY